MEVQESTGSMGTSATSEGSAAGGSQVPGSVAASISQPASATQSLAGSAHENVSTQENVQLPTYNPNFKYKVKGEEKEFDEMFRSLVKDADTEKKVREFHEKAYGLDHLKKSHGELFDKFKDVNGKYEPLQKSLSTLSAYLNMGDFGTFFSKIGVPKEAIFKWAISEAEKSQLPPEQRNAHDEAMELKRKNFELEQQLEESRGTSVEAEVQMRSNELHMAMSQPEVSAIQQAFDGRRGQGAFRNFVIDYATAQFHRLGHDIPVNQAISDVLAILGSQMSPGGQQPNAMGAANGGSFQQNGQTSNAGAGYEKPPVIPNVNSRNTSPTKKLPRSLDDIRKLSRGQAV